MLGTSLYEYAQQSGGEITASILETGDEGPFSFRGDINSQSWDSSQVCVPHCPVIAREPYYFQGMLGARWKIGYGETVDSQMAS